MQSTAWVESEDQDVYEVESRVPLPRPFPLSSALSEKNAVVVRTKISHVNHRTDGHLLKVISRISLPTPPYTVSFTQPGSLAGLAGPAKKLPCGLIFNRRHVNVSSGFMYAHASMRVKWHSTAWLGRRMNAQVWDALCQSHETTTCFQQGPGPLLSKIWE